jgi:hypothetical protein
MDEKPAGLQVDRQAVDIEEKTTVTTHQGNAIGEKRPGSAVYFHGPGSLSFSPVSSP